MPPTGFRELIPWNLLRELDFSSHLALSNAQRGAAEIGVEVAQRRSLEPAAEGNDAGEGERRLTVLTRSECRRLLASRKVGRLAFVARAGVPLIVPVNYAFDGTSVLIRSGPGPKLQAAEREDMVSFEIDDFDEHTRCGWSVVVTGRAKRLQWAHQGKRAGLPVGAAVPQPWAAGPRAHLMSIEPARLSGRRLGLVGVA